MGMCTGKIGAIFEKGSVNIVNWNSEIEFIVGYVFAVPFDEAGLHIKQKRKNLLAHQAQTLLLVIHESIVPFVGIRFKFTCQNLLALPEVFFLGLVVLFSNRN